MLANFAALGSLLVGCDVDHDEAAFASVGNTGCDAEGLVAFDFDEERQTWSAACRDKNFLCSQINRDITCTLQEEPLSSDVQVKVNHILKLDAKARVAFTPVQLAEVPWDRFSRQVQVAGALSAEQIEELDSIEQVYLDLPADLDARVKKCSRTGWYKFETTGSDFRYPPMDACVEDGFLHDPRLEGLAKGPMQKGYMLVGVSQFKALPKPELPVAPPVEQAPVEKPKPEPVSDETLALENEVRVWLSQNATQVTECVAEPRVAVVVDVETNGTVQVHLRGERAASAEERCVVAALEGKAFSNGPAHVLHLVEAPASRSEAQAGSEAP